MLDKKVDNDKHIKVLMGFFKVILEHPDPLDQYIDNLLEGLKVISQCSQFVEFGSGYNFFLVGVYLVE